MAALFYSVYNGLSTPVNTLSTTCQHFVTPGCLGHGLKAATHQVSCRLKRQLSCQAALATVCRLGHGLQMSCCKAAHLPFKAAAHLPLAPICCALPPPPRFFEASFSSTSSRGARICAHNRIRQRVSGPTPLCTHKRHHSSMHTLLLHAHTTPPSTHYSSMHTLLFYAHRTHAHRTQRGTLEIGIHSSWSSVPPT